MKRLVFFAILIFSLLAAGVACSPAANRVSEVRFEPSCVELSNPKRGFYEIRCYMADDDSVDLNVVSEYGLILLEINLKQYRSGDISSGALRNIDAYLSAWAGSGHSLIVRFLYDWDGQGLESEPDDLDIVLGHMSQVGPVLNQYEDSIFVVQGLFVGSWGEMHSTKFEEDFDVLLNHWSDVLDDGIYLSVRTPAMWRLLGCDSLSNPVGLFNDGMLGSATDLGTYDQAVQGGERRDRFAELRFQDELCRTVPNGGEVVIDNLCNDFDKAVESLSQMHVSYLNGLYDKKVLDKWASTIISDGGCFDGLTGLEYMERRLGYRYWISDASIDDNHVSVEFQNDGFAPAYFDLDCRLSIRNVRTGAEQVISGVGDLRECLDSMRVEFDFDELLPGLSEFYVRVVDARTGDTIQLANKFSESNGSFYVGAVTR